MSQNLLSFINLTHKHASSMSAILQFIIYACVLMELTINPLVGVSVDKDKMNKKILSIFCWL